MFYVYEWYIIETGEIIYVGKGTGNRYKQRNGRNDAFNSITKTHPCDCRIIKYFEVESDAFSYEHKRIVELQEVGECKCNLNSGGSGGISMLWSDERRKRNSLSKSRPVIIGEKEYKSITEARIAYNTDYSTISNWCKKGINKYGEKCRFKDEEQVEFADRRYNKARSKPVIFRNKEYSCAIDMAEDIGIKPCTAYKWLWRGFNSAGEPCRYKDDDRKLVFEDRHAIRNKARTKPVIVNGIKYESCKVASESLGIPNTTLYNYLQGHYNNPKYVCSYY